MAEAGRVGLQRRCAHRESCGPGHIATLNNPEGTCMSAEKETVQRVQGGLFHLQKGLTPFVEARMKTVHGARWLHYASRAQGSASNAPLDAYGLVKTMIDR